MSRRIKISLVEETKENGSTVSVNKNLITLIDVEDKDFTRVNEVVEKAVKELVNK